MYPHERSLVQRLQNKPFVLLGVNSDTDREELKEVLKKEKITWRSFWAGGTNGPIPSRWQIEGWPTIYLIDAEGVIRQKYLGGGADFDREIDKLVQEAESNNRVS
jgi:Thioredoxin-like